MTTDDDPQTRRKQLLHDIAEALNDVRQHRYLVVDKDWMDPVIERFGDQLIPVEMTAEQRKELGRSLVARDVYRQESVATKRTNKILRDIGATGRVPLGWGDGPKWRDMMAEWLVLPLAIGDHRVQLGHATPVDLEQWELQSAREQDKRNEAEAEARKGARLLAALLAQNGVRRVQDFQLDPAE